MAQGQSGGGLEDLIRGIKDSYKRTNIKDIDLSEGTQRRTHTRLGYFLQNINNASEKEYSINFDPVQNIFLQKLVSEEVLDSRVILTSEEYFKGIVFVDYLVDTVLCDKSLLSDLFDIAKWLEAHDEKLDPDLKLFALYGAITFKRIHSDKKKRKSLGDETRYNEVNEAVDGEYLDYRRIDPMYESLGCMVYDLVEDAEMKRELDNIEGVSDLKAVVFIDSLMPLLAEEDRSVIHGIMASGGYYKASMYAMKSLADRTDGKDVKDYVAELRQSVA